MGATALAECCVEFLQIFYDLIVSQMFLIQPKFMMVVRCLLHLTLRELQKITSRTRLADSRVWFMVGHGNNLIKI